MVVMRRESKWYELGGKSKVRVVEGEIRYIYICIYITLPCLTLLP